MFRRARALVCLVAALAALGGGLGAAPALPTDDASITHALSRLTFGVGPGDLDRVRQIGLPDWIDAQLRPAGAADPALDTRLSAFKTVSLDSNQVAREYVMPARAAKRERQRAQARADDSTTPGSTPDRVPPAGAAVAGGERQVIQELASAKLIRAVYSERQLEEVLVDFWFNHFNVFAGKGRTSTFLGEYEREAIRPHVLGPFRELLEATAKSPAMLFYLDNWMNSDPGAPDGFAVRNRPAGSARGAGPARRAGPGLQTRQPQVPRANQKRPRGLNENYGRELLELHTLGVDGGYTQKDVTEVARAFTGWTIDPRDQTFRFVPALHDNGAKVVLGHVLKAGGGIGDGERVLEIVASHPATARHIAMQLAQRFVSDEPPPALVDRAAARFRETGGNLREVVRTIVTSPEFFSAEAREAKVKTPLEFVASALRATRADIADPRPLLRALQQLGMPLYMCQPPTGYDDTAATWVSSGALVSRMNVALDLGNPRSRAFTDPLTRAADVTTLRVQLIRDALGGTVSSSTRETIEKATTPQQTIALVLGSPEFQKR